MKRLTRRIVTTVPIELYAAFEKLCQKYRKKPIQVMRELIATACGRIDLAGDMKSSETKIANHLKKANISIERIQFGDEKGWTPLIESINDLIFHNQISVTKNLIDQALRVAESNYSESSQLVKDIHLLKLTWETRLASVDWDRTRFWVAGPPKSVGEYLIAGKTTKWVSRIEDDCHPDLNNPEVHYHLRIPTISHSTSPSRQIMSQTSPDDQSQPSQNLHQTDPSPL